MYERHFHLTCRPFDLASDPKFLYTTEQHSRAASNIRFALLNRDTFVVISGGIGTGKTTVLNTAMTEVDAKFVTARIVHTTLSDVELLQALLSEFGIPDYGTQKVKLLDKLRTFFLDQHRAGRHVVIIVDEAQHLNSAALEELRLLTCIDSQDRRILTIVLTGQPALDDVLDDPSLAQLRQRTRLRQRLRPMDQSETTAYIRHRLRVAGGDADKIFAPDVFAEIYRLTLGTPRLINTLCDMALFACMVRSKRRVEMSMVEDVVDELGWRWDKGGGRRRRDPGEEQAASLPPGEQAMLMVYVPGKPAARVDIASVPFLIGRSEGNGLVIGGKDTSRRHASIDKVGSRYILEDLNSRNGLLVNGKTCLAAKLVPGDVIGIGRAKLVFGLQQDLSEDTGEQVTLTMGNVVELREPYSGTPGAPPAKDGGT